MKELEAENSKLKRHVCISGSGECGNQGRPAAKPVEPSAKHHMAQAVVTEHSLPGFGRLSGGRVVADCAVPPAG